MSSVDLDNLDDLRKCAARLQAMGGAYKPIGESYIQVIDLLDVALGSNRILTLEVQNQYSTIDAQRIEIARLRKAKRSE